MPIRKLLSFVKSSLIGSSFPSESEEGRQFLQERLAFFGKVGGLICLGAIISHHVTFLLDPQRTWKEWLMRPVMLFQLPIFGLFVAMWGICRRGSPSARALATVEAFGLIGICTGAAIITWIEDWLKYKEFWGVLIATNCLIFRALVVPGTAARTFWLSSAACIPTVIGTYLIHRSREPSADDSPLWLYTALSAQWCGVAVVVSTVASHVIFSLRLKVHEAKRLGRTPSRRSWERGAWAWSTRPATPCCGGRRPSSCSSRKPPASRASPASSAKCR